MRSIREILRLHFEVGLSFRAVGTSLGVSHVTVSDLVTRFHLAGLTWPLEATIDDGALQAHLYPGNAGRPRQRPAPDWAQIHHELRARKSMTLQLLWVEYRAEQPQGYGYTQFCQHYRTYAKRLDLALRQVHHPGDKCFVDYAGETVPIVDAATGEMHPAQIFVAVLGASNYTFAEAHPSQDIASWIQGHVHAFQAFRGVPAAIVPDNLKAGVIRAHPYDPRLNSRYREMAQYYGVTILPARVRQPRDKAKAEAGVQLVERWILAVLRHQTFFSIADLNTAMAEALQRLTRKPFQKLPGNRETLGHTEDQPALQPLPAPPYVFGEWRKALVHKDYHIQVDIAFYRVPYRLVGQEVAVRLTASTVEIFHDGHRVASHARATRKGQACTLPAHRPPAHRRWTDWTPDRFLRWARHGGPATEQVVAAVFAGKPYPEEGYRTCFGILSLAKKGEHTHLERVAQQALTQNIVSYRGIKILWDTVPRAPGLPAPATPPHAHLRGPRYFAVPGLVEPAGLSPTPEVSHVD